MIVQKIIFGAIVILLFILSVYVNARHRESRFTKAVIDSAAVIAAIVAVLQYLSIGPTYWLNLSATSRSGVGAPMSTPQIDLAPTATPPGQLQPPSFLPSSGDAAPTPPQGPNGKLLYNHGLDDPEDSPDWNAADYDYGAAGYDGMGYYVLSRIGGRSHVMVNQKYALEAFVLEVLATPLSEESVTAILIVFDAGYLGAGGYYYVIAPNGVCGLGVVGGDDIDIIDSQATCPSLNAGQSYRIRLEVVDGRLGIFVDDQQIKEYTLPHHSGGYIGLGVHNFALEDSPTVVKVRFNNLTIWSLNE